MKQKIKNKNDLKISACMMVKNEEKMLPRCLNSIRHIVDEIIVVDTGSTDGTIEIATSFGAKIYHHPWEDDFSKHRNQSIGYATGDWFIIIDADEELDAYHLKKEELKHQLFTAPVELHCFLIKLLDKGSKGTTASTAKSARIFRNRVGVEYRGIVHNTAHYTGKVMEMDLRLFHYGYALPKEQMQAKYKRTSSLLRKRIENDPQDYAAYFYLCQVHMQMGASKEAIQSARQCLAILPPKEQKNATHSFYYSLYHSITASYITLNQYDKAERTAREGLVLLPDEIDLFYDIACIGVVTGNFPLIIEGAENYLRVLAEFRTTPLRYGTRFVFSTSENIQQTVEYWLMTAYISLDRLTDALELWEQNKKFILSKSPFQMELLLNLERKEAWDHVEAVTLYLFEHLESIDTGNRACILSYLIFCLRKKEDLAFLEKAVTNYLDLTEQYNEIPDDTTIVIAEFLLKKGLGDFFLDMTLSLFEKKLPTAIKVLDNAETIADGYNRIAKLQPKTVKGNFLASLCLNISWGLTEDDQYLEAIKEIYRQQKPE